MGTVRARGFTLIELLTVVTIISILAALTAVAVPGAIARARLRSAENAMKQMSTALTQYFTEEGSYPPGYGYMRFSQLQGGGLTPDQRIFWLQPWNAMLGMYSNDDMRDPYAENHDTNMNGSIEMLEFLPVGQQLGPQQLVYPTSVFNPFNAAPAEIASDIQRQLNTERPYVYIPVNLNDFRKVQAYYNNTSGSNFVERQRAAIWDTTSQALQSVQGSRPAKYDAFALISVGPGGTTAGVLPTPIQQSGPNVYYMTGLRAYFLATRDANNNGSKDFDYRSRTAGGEDRTVEAYQVDGLAPFAGELVLMPDGTGAQGPLILSN